MYYHQVHLDLHLAVGPGECRRMAEASLQLSEVLSYPTNKLHGSAILFAPTAEAKAGDKGDGASKKGKVMGTIDYWFKLHTAGGTVAFVIYFL